MPNKNRNGTDLPRDRINTLPGKDSHLCLIVCFTSSSEHTISNRLNAGPLTQTGFPDGGRLFHSTGKQQGGGVVGSFFFFADGVGNCSYMPHPDEARMGHEPEPTGVCLPCMSHITPGCIHFNRYYTGLTNCSLLVYRHLVNHTQTMNSLLAA